MFRYIWSKVRLVREEIVLECLKQMLMPVMGFCIRHSIGVQALFELAKAAFVEAAGKELAAKNCPVNVSQISVLTGLRRREVGRLFNGRDKRAETYSLMSRVINRWLVDKRFTTKSGKPRVLEADGYQSEFHKMVRSVSKDLSPGTVLQQMHRAGLISETPRGVRLLKPAYVPKHDPVEGFRLLAMDSNDLALCVEENVLAGHTVPNLHVVSEYDNIPAEYEEELRSWALREGTRFHEKVRNYISNFDRDTSGSQAGEGRIRLIIGSFSRSSNWNESENAAED